MSKHSGDLATNPARYMPDLSGKIILITGGTNGLGAQSAVELARHSPKHIYISGRNSTAASNVIKQVQDQGSKTEVAFLQCDLADLASVRTATDKVLAEQTHLDVLMATAGIMAKPPSLTKDGYEIQFGTNHLGNALLIRKLLPLLQNNEAEGRDTRIIITTSLGWQGAPKSGIRFEELRTPQDMFFGSWLRYGQSKLANLLYARELARRYPNITTVSVHPGVIQTDLINSLPLSKRVFVRVTSAGMKIPLEEGCWSQIWCVGAPKAVIHANNGAF
ncbi:dehydrogenase with different specificitie [Xylariaceae sp. FL0016]|nr:dehydrogenase with different specificitie [Xylariaceae sp. FL0016]